MKDLITWCQQKSFWIIAVSVYLSLIYSTGLHFVYGEHAFGTYFLTIPRRENSKLDAGYSDRGQLAQVNLEVSGSNLWKLTAAWQDAGTYLLQSKSISLSIAPFKYRLFPTLLIGLISDLVGRSISQVFTVINVILTLITAILFTIYLQRLQFNRTLTILGGILYVTMLANTATMAFPMLEPASFLMITLIFLSVLTRNIPLFLLSSIVGVVTKEILLISSLLWIVNYLTMVKSFRLADLVSNGLIASIPILVFMSVRILLGGSPLEVNFGYDLLRGQMPNYWTRILSISALFRFFVGTFLSFSFLWLGLLNIRKEPFLYRNSFVIPLVILATFLLSGGVARVIGILFPIIIPLFLLFFDYRSSNLLGGVHIIENV